MLDFYDPVYFVKALQALGCAILYDDGEYLWVRNENIKFGRIVIIPKRPEVDLFPIKIVHEVLRKIEINDGPFIKEYKRVAGMGHKPPDLSTDIIDGL